MYSLLTLGYVIHYPGRKLIGPILQHKTRIKTAQRMATVLFLFCKRSAKISIV